MAATFPNLHYIANLQNHIPLLQVFIMLKLLRYLFYTLVFVIFQCKTSCLYWWRCWG